MNCRCLIGFLLAKCLTSSHVLNADRNRQNQERQTHPVLLGGQRVKQNAQGHDGVQLGRGDQLLAVVAAKVQHFDDELVKQSLQVLDGLLLGTSAMS